MSKVAERVFDRHTRDLTVPADQASKALTELGIEHDFQRVDNGYGRQIGRNSKRADTLIIRYADCR